MAPSIVLATDFGLEGPYTGQVKAVLYRVAPGLPVIDLFSDLAASNPRPAAYLLAAYSVWFAPGTIFLGIVDPGVGGTRSAIVVDAAERWYVGPDNGLFELVVRRAAGARIWDIASPDKPISASFHGRDLFAPAAGRLARGEVPAGPTRNGGLLPCRDWPDDLAEIVYIDRFGNAMTGLRAAVVPARARLSAGGRVFARQQVFSDVLPGEAFWYENANGLAEIAVNSGRADATLELEVGTRVEILK